MISVNYNNFIDRLNSLDNIDFLNVIKKSFLELGIDISHNHIFFNLLSDYFEIISSKKIKSLLSNTLEFMRNFPSDQKKRWELLILKISNSVYHRVNKTECSELVGFLFLQVCHLIKLTDRSGLNLNRDINSQKQISFRSLNVDNIDIQKEIHSIFNLFRSNFLENEDTILNQYRRKIETGFFKKEIKKENNNNLNERLEFFDSCNILRLIPQRIKRKSLHIVSALVLRFIMHIAEGDENFSNISNIFAKLLKITDSFARFEIDTNINYIKWIIKSEKYWNLWIKQGANPFEKIILVPNFGKKIEIMKELSSTRKYSIRSDFISSSYLKSEKKGFCKIVHYDQKQSQSWIDYRKNIK